MSDVPDLLSLAQRLREHDRMPDSAAEVEWAAARIAALQAEIAEAKAVPLVQLLKDYNEEEARAELAGLKDVEADIADMAVAAVNKAIRDKFGSGEADGRERWLVRSGAAAIAPALIARERERAATVCEALAERERAVGSYFAAVVAETLATKVRAGAAP